MWNVCPRCNHLNDDDSTRCEQCGHRLGGPKPPEQRTVPKTPQASQTQPPATYEFKVRHRTRISLNDWFGPRVPFKEKRRNVTIVIVSSLMLLLALGYAAAGLYCNTIVWVVFGVLLSMVVASMAKREWSEEKTVAFVLLLALPLLIAGVLPWQPLFEEDDDGPVFVDHLGYLIVDGATDGSKDVRVTGFISNEGQVGGEALVILTVNGGSPDEGTLGYEAFVHDTVNTGWIPAGGTANIDWTCNVSYFSADGYVNWDVVNFEQ